MIYDTQTKKCWHRNQKLIDRLNNRTAELVRKRQETAAAEKAAADAAVALVRGPAEAAASLDEPMSQWKSSATGSTPKRMPLPKAMPRDMRQVPARQEDPDSARIANRWGRWKRTINQDSLDKSVRCDPDYCDFFHEHQLVFCADADPIGWGGLSL